MESFTVESAAVKPDGSVMLTAYFDDAPEYLYGFDNIKFVETDDSFAVDYEASVSCIGETPDMTEEQAGVKAHELMSYIVSSFLTNELAKVKQ